MVRNRINNKKIAPWAATVMLISAGSSIAAEPRGHDQASLDAQLAHSEARIEALQQRIKELESRLDMLASPSMVRIRAPSMGQANVTAQTSPPASSSEASAAETASSGTQRRAPGTFEVDEAAAQRALERTLIQTGALLLPRGTVELTPRLGYTRFEFDTPTAATITDPTTGASGLSIINQRSRVNKITAGLGLRVGLPLDAQFEANLPFNYVRMSRVDGLGSEQSDNASGSGDITLGMAKTFLREAGARPDLLGRLSYNFGNGRQQSRLISFDAGFRQLQAEVVALKRQDPLAFTASAFYNRVFEENSVKPGDAVGITLGAALAASPATSLQFSFTQIHRQKQELNGGKIAGSDQTYGVFGIGATSVLSRDITLVTQLGVGLGSDAPKYSLVIALPILFQ